MIASLARWLTPPRAAVLLWLCVTVVSLLLAQDRIAALETIDPDDALRMVQVRDLVAGQAWWDVMQHRVNPAGGGGLMHWSRIVDLPMATGIMLLSPMVGQALAERVVFAIVPFLLLLPLFWAVMRIAQRLGDVRIAYVAPAMLAANYIILLQFGPLRIDHHGWQIMLAGVVLALTLPPADYRSGLWAGIAAAASVAISLEALATAAVFAVIIGAEWIWSGTAATRQRLVAYLGSLFAASAALQFATRGPGALVERWCDALSLPYLAALAVAAGIVAIEAGLLREEGATSPRARAARMVQLAVAAGASLAALLWVEPACAQGPFGALDPVVQRYWYANIREGMPLWYQLDGAAAFAATPMLIGLIGSMIALRHARMEHRRAWLILTGALIGAVAIALFVQRAMSVAHVFALPGAALLAILIWQWARAMRAALPRIAATLLVFFTIPPTAGATAAIITMSAIGEAAEKPNAGGRIDCFDQARVAALNGLPAATLLTPLDMGSHILQHTHHAVVATGHHRNNAIMATVISTFIGPVEDAQARARSTGAQMIVICPDAREFGNFRTAAGDTLAKRLYAGDPPAWLTPVPLGGGGALRVWRIDPPANAP